jgi:hypothetical protein
VSDYAPDVDHEFIPFLDMFNSLPGVETTQSCTGHGKDGFISLRFSWPHWSFAKIFMALQKYDHAMGGEAAIQLQGFSQSKPRWVIWFSSFPGDVKRLYRACAEVIDSV